MLFAIQLFLLLGVPTLFTKVPAGEYDAEVKWRGHAAARAHGRITHLRDVKDPRSGRRFGLAVVQWDLEVPAIVLVQDDRGGLHVGEDVSAADALSPARWPPGYFVTIHPLAAVRDGFEARSDSRLLFLRAAVDGLTVEMSARRSLGHISLPGWKRYVTVRLRRRSE